MLSCLLPHPAWKQSGHILKGKDKEVNKTGKYKQEKRNQVTRVSVQRPFPAQIYGYIRDERSGGELSLPSIGRPLIY